MRLVLALLLWPGVTFGQAGRGDHATWFSLGAGVGGGGQTGPFATRIAGTYQYRVGTLSFRATGINGWDSDVVSELGVLAGLAVPPNIGHASLAAGVGLASVRRHPPVFGPPLLPDAEGLGFLWEARLAVRALPIGIGLAAFGNVNEFETFNGVVLEVTLGAHWTARHQGAR